MFAFMYTASTLQREKTICGFVFRLVGFFFIFHYTSEIVHTIIIIIERIKRFTQKELCVQY